MTRAASHVSLLLVACFAARSSATSTASGTYNYRYIDCKSNLPQFACAEPQRLPDGSPSLPRAESRRGAGMTPTPVLRLGSSPLLLGSTLGDGACAILRPHARRENTSASPLSQEWARDASMYETIHPTAWFGLGRICSRTRNPMPDRPESRKAVMPKRESGWSQAVLVGPCGLGLRCGGDEGSKLFSSLGLSTAAAVV